MGVMSRLNNHANDIIENIQRDDVSVTDRKPSILIHERTAATMQRGNLERWQNTRQASRNIKLILITYSS